MPPKASKGAKAKKGLSAKKNRRGAGNARNNPKAFAASSGPKAMRNKAYRSLEKQEKQYHVQRGPASRQAALRDARDAAAALVDAVTRPPTPEGVAENRQLDDARRTMAWGAQDLLVLSTLINEEISRR